MLNYREYFYDTAIKNGYAETDISIEYDIENDMEFMVLSGCKDGIYKELYIYDKEQKPLLVKDIVFTPTTRDYNEDEKPCYYYDMGEEVNSVLKAIRYVFNKNVMKGILNTVKKSR